MTHEIRRNCLYAALSSGRLVSCLVPRAKATLRVKTWAHRIVAPAVAVRESISQLGHRHCWIARRASSSAASSRARQASQRGSYVQSNVFLDAGLVQAGQQAVVPRVRVPPSWLMSAVPSVNRSRTKAKVVAATVRGAPHRSVLSANTASSAKKMPRGIPVTYL